MLTSGDLGMSETFLFLRDEPPALWSIAGKLRPGVRGRRPLGEQPVGGAFGLESNGAPELFSGDLGGPGSRPVFQ